MPNGERREHRRAETFVRAAAVALSTSTPEITDDHIEFLWKRLARIFGHKWTSAYGLIDDGTWRAGLIDMRPDELQTGLMGCLNWPDEWPPTLPQFRALCRPRREEAHRIYQALPEPPEAKARRLSGGLAAIGGIREGMRLTEWLERHKGRKEAADSWIYRNIHGMRATR